MSSLSRRHFFAAATTTGAAGILAARSGGSGKQQAVAATAARPSPSPRQVPLPSGPFRIDVHAHTLPPSYHKALLDKGITTIGGVPTPDWSPELAMTFMNSFGIKTQILSVSSPGVSFLSGTAAADLARDVNCYMAELIKSEPARFGGMAVLPLPDIPASLTELRRALDQDKLDGVCVLSNYGGTYLGDPRFEPLWAELNRRRTYVFLHPETPQDNDRPDLGLAPFAFEFTFDTTRSVTHLAAKKVFTRYPGIRWQIAHSGGTVPFLSYRLGLGVALANGGDLKLVDEVAGVFRNLRYDTALSPVPAAQRSVLAVTDVNHVLFGSDWPFARAIYRTPGDPQPQLSQTYDNAQRLLIERNNALREFPRLTRS